MARAIWNGAINFGLVSVPVKLFSAVRPNELRFHFLHDADNSRINNQRVCERCGKPVEWDHVVRGFEVEKGKFVILTDEDFKRVDVEATQSVEIMEFVQLAEIDPVLFDKPYYLEPEKKGRHAYALLRDVLAKTEKVGIARVVLRTREHLAAVRPRGEALVLELMHFADEIVDSSDLDFPASTPRSSAAEMKSATMLVDTMTAKFDATEFKDRYREELMALIDARASGQRMVAKKGRQVKRPSNVIDLKAILDQSVQEMRKQRKPATTTRKPKRVA